MVCGSHSQSAYSALPADKCNPKILALFFLPPIANCTGKKAGIREINLGKEGFTPFFPEVAMPKNKAQQFDRIYRLRISLDDLEPEIWRSIEVDGAIPMDRLHLVFQVAMGWEGTADHRFLIANQMVQPLNTELEEGEDEAIDERSVTLDQLLQGETRNFAYDYHFADGWCHTVKVEEVLAPTKKATYPRCTDGERAAPPEGCGGPYDYEKLLNVLDDPEHPGFVRAQETCGEFFDPDAFDLQETNEQLSALSLRPQPA